MKFRGGPAAVIGDVGDKAISQPLVGTTPPGRCHRTVDPRARRPAGSDSPGAKSDGKGFGQALRLADAPIRASEFMLKHLTETKQDGKQASSRPDVIAIRKTCDAEGTGLSHYVLMDKQVKQ